MGKIADLIIKSLCKKESIGDVLKGNIPRYADKAELAIKKHIAKIGRELIDEHNLKLNIK